MLETTVQFFGSTPSYRTPTTQSPSLRSDWFAAQPESNHPSGSIATRAQRQKTERPPRSV